MSIHRKVGEDEGKLGASRQESYRGNCLKWVEVVTALGCRWKKHDIEPRIEDASLCPNVCVHICA